MPPVIEIREGTLPQMNDSLWSHDYVRVSKLLIPNLGKIFLGMWSAKKRGVENHPSVRLMHSPGRHFPDHETIPFSVQKLGNTALIDT